MLVKKMCIWSLNSGTKKYSFFICFSSGMYLILIIYSLCNVHVVSWGTRENKPVKTQEELETDKKQAEAMSKAKGAQGR